MTTMKKTMGRLVAALALAASLSAAVTACDDDTTSTTVVHDMAMTSSGDMTMETCVANPTTGEEFLNACTTAQTGDPAKDAPYSPTLAPGGQLPPLP
jgi:hypothetical protein